MYTLFQQWRTRRQNSTAQQVGQVLSNQGYPEESTRLLEAVTPIIMSDVALHSLQHGRGGLEFGSFLGCVPSSGVTIGLCCNNFAATEGLPSITSSLCWISSCLPCGSALACGLLCGVLCFASALTCGNPTEEHEEGCDDICHGGFYATTLGSCCGDD